MEATRQGIKQEILGAVPLPVVLAIAQDGTILEVIGCPHLYPGEFCRRAEEDPTVPPNPKRDSLRPYCRYALTNSNVPWQRDGNLVYNPWNTPLVPIEQSSIGTK